MLSHRLGQHLVFGLDLLFQELDALLFGGMVLAPLGLKGGGSVLEKLFLPTVEDRCDALAQRIALLTPFMEFISTIDHHPYFCNHRNMKTVSSKKNAEQVAKFADMFSAMGTEARLRIMQLLLSAHPEGLVVGEIQSELDIPNSTLSHHLDKLRNENLVVVNRESTFLRYTANTEALQQVLQFLYAECCTRNKAVAPRDVVQICK
jgi:ArsR family transcriptional regulator, arsenate/arsenite/antimonite-responsive transcriptional repressor